MYRIKCASTSGISVCVIKWGFKQWWSIITPKQRVWRLPFCYNLQVSLLFKGLKIFSKYICWFIKLFPMHLGLKFEIQHFPACGYALHISGAPFQCLPQEAVRVSCHVCLTVRQGLSAGLVTSWPLSEQSSASLRTHSPVAYPNHMSV